MTPETYTFGGNVVTVIGLVGVVSTVFIVVTSFRKFFNSPYNIRVTPKQVSTEMTTEIKTTVS